ncbi:potassium transporter [Macleaya cordata]|uniref:Potassium transporter n=1 Tax=Macleaya cordata TaxID=56857 RepID=A0A200Q1Q0_MACCD|nr:potassium transporter [Macleaya cordata]
MQNIDWGTILKLAFQSIGVVYGDIGTSPLYVLPGIFPNGIKHNDDLLGVLSLIIYTLTLITLIKYVFIVLSANDNGDGGTFALYSLICRYAKVGFIPNHQAEDKDVSNYRLDAPNRRLSRASAVKSMLENSRFAKYLLLLITMLGTSMVIGDGILTPCISVLSAVGGIREAAKNLNDDKVMWISVVILFLLFQVQRFGTDKVGYSFAPILTIWFIFIGSIGIFNFVKHDPTVIKALNPMYIVHYFMRNKKDAWISLGGVVLCLTGSEALFADLGHFNVRSIQISTCTIVFPSIILAYTGQAAYLRKHNLDATDAFYKSVPVPVYWPMFVVAVLAAIIASQSLISATFSIVQQSLALGCFPKVKVVHTSSTYKGQVYIPEINFLLMFACIGVTLGFKNTLTIGNAYGLAVVFVMSLTSSLLVLVMIMIWKTNFFLIITYVLTIMLLELLYLSSVLYKFVDGGYLPLIFAAFMMSVMYTWNYVYRKKYLYDLENKVTIQKLKEIASDPEIRRLPGLAVFYSELVQGISPIFTHYIANVPALHSILLFVSIKFLPISKVPPEERFLFRRVQPHELAIFRCVVRYGYTEERMDGEHFEEMLVGRLKEFIIEECNNFGTEQIERPGEIVLQANASDCDEDDEVVLPRINDEEVARELLLVDNECKDSGVTYFLGQNEVVASKESNSVKRIMINYAYNLLKRLLRQQEEVFAIPRKRLLKVGMTYEL